jgi:hypothetical protein
MFSIAGVWVLVATSSFAQNPTGTISGRVSDETGLPMPGVTITAGSPNLQGRRSTVSTEHGDYILSLLPPGEYSVNFELAGFRPLERTLSVAPTEVVGLDVTMAVGGVSERVTVVGSAPNFVETAQVATKFEQELVSALPTNRTLDASVLLAPGVHPTGPLGNYSFGGSVSFESAFVLNGAVIHENLRAQPQPLYIEDAIQDVTVATSGVSAEYGRFTGGIVTAVTKSGGNAFSGSFRTSLANDAWREKTPIERQAGTPLTSVVVPTYEYTAGGPITRDKIWFFTAGRFQQQSETRTTAVTAIPYERGTDEKRFEGKATYSPVVGHMLKAGYIGLQFEERGQTGQNVMDTASLVTRQVPQDLVSFHYAAVLRPNLSIEAQYSGRHFTFQNSGARFTDEIKGTLLIDRSRGTSFRYWSPTFCGVCGDEKRDNQGAIVKASYFASTGRFGAHSIVGGYDMFNEQRFSNNHQSGSDFRILGTSTVVQGTTIFPVFLSTTTSGQTSTIIQNDPIGQETLGSNFRTHSLFLNDSWRASDKWSFSLGLRADRNASRDASGRLVAADTSLSPRLSATWDPLGDGRWSVTGGFARYVAAVSTAIADVSAAGVPATYQYLYSGPSINTDASAPLVPTDVAIQRVFEWFKANGGTNRPFLSADIPGVATIVGDALKSPVVSEVNGGVGRQFGSTGSLRVDVAYRDYGDFYATRVDRTTGRVTNSVGREFDRKLIENTNDVRREYAGMTMFGTYRPHASVDMGGSYTLSKTWGNYDGESATSPLSAFAVYYPEYSEERWNRPDGDLAVDQRHRVRLWGTYTPHLTDSAGVFSVGIVQQIGSGVPYGAIGLIDTKPYVVNPGYVAPDGSRSGGTWDYYFTARDEFRTETTYRTDLALNYGYRLPGGRSPELFVHADILNVFNQLQLCGCGGTVFNNGGGTDMRKINQAVQIVQTFNPFTVNPVEGTHWRKAPTFGQAVDRFSYTTPRVYRFNVGVRF